MEPSLFFFSVFRSLRECEKLVRETYQKNGLVYIESSSEEEEDGAEGILSSEVIEIDDDDDDDVIAVGCCECPLCISYCFDN